ncbi:hypothetical protein [Microcoleus sp. A003_D6]|uniref:hypothetical protein n=1 Tax=Microcoleus sp. A003_D6 TaxID=3055266 RepID=UPI002FCF291D
MLELKSQGCVSPKLNAASASQALDSREAEPPNLRPQAEPGNKKKSEKYALRLVTIHKTSYFPQHWMTFFNASEPLIRCKQEHLDVQDREGLLQLRWQIGNITLFSGLYTRIDQTFLLWGLVTGGIFFTAQFVPISWSFQAILWSTLTLIGTAGMAVLTLFWVRVERVSWILYSWAILMITGLVLTDCSIFAGWGGLLLHLCDLWLGLSAIGYFCTGLGLRSRTFIAIGLTHLFSIPLLTFVAPWQYLTTGIIMAGCLLLLSELQWDMRSPIDNTLLSEEQKEFNRIQQQLRQIGAIVSK